MKGMGRLWQSAATVQSVLKPGLLEKAAEAGLRSLFVGFETLDPANLREHDKFQNLNRDYNAAIRRLHSLIMLINDSFDFGINIIQRTVFVTSGNRATKPTTVKPLITIDNPYAATE